MSEPWKPRKHDHLVEPLLGGLQDRAPARGGSKLWIVTAVVFVLLVARVVTLLV